MANATHWADRSENIRCMSLIYNWFYLNLSQTLLKALLTFAFLSHHFISTKSNI